MPIPTLTKFYQAQIELEETMMHNLTEAELTDLAHAILAPPDAIIVMQTPSGTCEYRRGDHSGKVPTDLETI